LGIVAERRWLAKQLGLMGAGDSKTLHQNWDDGLR